MVPESGSRERERGRTGGPLTLRCFDDEGLKAGLHPSDERREARWSDGLPVTAAADAAAARKLIAETGATVNVLLGLAYARLRQGVTGHDGEILVPRYLEHWDVTLEVGDDPRKVTVEVLAPDRRTARKVAALVAFDQAARTARNRRGRLGDSRKGPAATAGLAPTARETGAEQPAASTW